MEKFETEQGPKEERLPSSGDFFNLQMEAKNAATGANTHMIDSTLAALEGAMELADRDGGWTDETLSIYREGETELRKEINKARLAKGGLY